ncbi:MAG TPA: sigma-E factor negative regulatory protein, partial [Aquabacterium sp.]|nr:sigma-E factor negative regulatory protein [Aquabacterium sp.]
MSERMDDAAFSFEALSALTDGEANEREVARACAAWRDSEEARARWQTYQLVGDVMRSDGLARGKRSDADFLAGVRDRLVQEPVVLAPATRPVIPAQPSVQARPAVAQVLHHRRWAGPMSVAAGFVLVIGAVVSSLNGGSLAPSMTPQGSQGAVMAQGATGQGGAPALAQAFSGADAPLPAAWSPGLSQALTADSSVPQRVMASHPSFTENTQGAGSRVGYVVFMRDDQLDQLLAAQREQAEARSLASPSGSIRSVSLGADE